MILVVGATGMVGGEICARLAASGTRMRALVRPASDPGKVERLRALGAEIVEGDLRDPRSLEAACRDVEAVISTASAMPFAYVPDSNTPATTDRDGIISLVDAASRAGVTHFVYTSFPHAEIDYPLQDAKRAVEGHLRASGLTYTILQPTFFTEVWLSPAVGFDYLNHKAAIYGEGTNPITFISYRDVAQFAVASLNNPAARNATLLLGGPEALSPLDVVGIFEKVGGHRWELAHVPAEALRAQAAAATDPMQKSFASLMVVFAMGQAIDMREVLRAFPLELTPVEEYARQVSPVTPTEVVA